MSAQLGTDTAATSNAISMALPILLGGLSKNAANAEGAAALDNALNVHDGGILDKRDTTPDDWETLTLADPALRPE